MSDLQQEIAKIPARVERGLAFKEKTYPGVKITREGFDICLPCNCVLGLCGQATKQSTDYDDAKPNYYSEKSRLELTAEQCIDMGFYPIRDATIQDVDRYCDALQEEWMRRLGD